LAKIYEIKASLNLKNIETRAPTHIGGFISSSLELNRCQFRRKQFHLQVTEGSLHYP